VAPKTRYVRSGDASIAYQVVGEGPPDLLFVSGFVSHLELIWEEPTVARFFDGLASFSRLILFDKRGLGLSDRTGGAPTLEQVADDALAVLDAAASESAAVFAISEGGPAAIVLAATYPERVSRLILYGTWPRIVRSPDYPLGFTLEQLRATRDHFADRWGDPVAVNAFLPSMVDDQAFVDWWARLLRLGTSPSGIVDLMSVYEEIDVRPALPLIQQPTLVLHRESDRLIPLAIGRFLAVRIPDCRLVELEGADHLAFAGDQAALLSEIEEFMTGTRSAHESRHRVLATVLFTDIVGSTERATELGDRRWRDLLHRHRAAVRRELTRFRGREIDTAGDGFLATFDGPARAIQCACSIRDAVDALGVEVRNGVHTGECELIDGGGVGGIAVHIGARVAALAEPGEVLVSRTVRDLVAGSGLVFEDRGVSRLKGVEGDWQLYAVA
jgi:pimeloyl-ACP methyl ester carboxylesterase